MMMCIACVKVRSGLRARAQNHGTHTHNVCILCGWTEQIWYYNRTRFGAHHAHYACTQVAHRDRPPPRVTWRRWVSSHRHCVFAPGLSPQTATDCIYAKPGNLFIHQWTYGCWPEYRDQINRRWWNVFAWGGPLAQKKKNTHCTLINIHSSHL